MHKFEESSIKQFDWWADNQVLFCHVFSSLNKRIAAIVNPEPNSSLLDIGCGWGLLLKEISLLKRNVKLCGIDISPRMVKAAQFRLQRVEQVDVSEGSASKLPYRDKSFDYVTCILSFHHHPDSKQSLREMYRVLKNHGTLFLLDPYNDGLVRKALIKISALFFSEKDTHIYAKKQMVELLEKAGFVSIQQSSLNFTRLMTTGRKSRV